MMVISLLIGLVAVALLLPTASDLLSLARIATGRRRRAITPAEELPRLLFLVPAHNEEDCIAEHLTSLLAQDHPALRIVISLDRCTDRDRQRASLAFRTRSGSVDPGRRRAGQPPG